MMKIDSFPFKLFITLPSLDDTSILGPEVNDIIPDIITEVNDYQYQDIPGTFSSVSYQDYLRISSLDLTTYDGMSSLVDILLPDVKDPSVKQSLDTIRSYINQRDSYINALPDFQTPVINHCPQTVKFNADWSTQISVSNVANEWHCSWNDVLSSKAVDVLEVLSYLGAKSSSEYFEYKFQQQKH